MRVNDLLEQNTPGKMDRVTALRTQIDNAKKSLELKKQEITTLTASIANLNKELSLAMKTNAQTAMAPPQPNTSTNPTQPNITQSNIAVT